jgi:hypothetical protein
VREHGKYLDKNSNLVYMYWYHIKKSHLPLKHKWSRATSYEFCYFIRLHSVIPRFLTLFPRKRLGG